MIGATIEFGQFFIAARRRNRSSGDVSVVDGELGKSVEDKYIFAR